MYSLHIDLASKCLDIINEQELTAVSEFEQELVTGVSSNGEPVTRTSLEIRLITLLDNQTIEKYDRIRLLFLYLVMVNGSNELDRRRLEQVPQCLTINDRRAASSEENHPDIPVDKCGKYEWNTVLQTNKDVMCTRFAPAVYSIIRAPKTKEGGVLVIYIAGGVTLSEMRTVYEIARTFNRQVYIGSTHIITPRGFVDDLKSLHLKMLM
ncbi:syntaxin binding protein 1 [Coemansia sp. Benny D160-2]|nr:syntaxin binding protein 1 [Coemansia sp. Benny D160-2]